MRFAGEFAALGTAFCWGLAANLFSAAGRRLGSQVLNRLRLLIGMILIASFLWIAKGSPWPRDATAFQIVALALSGLVGFVFGDAFHFRSLVILGPGRAALLLSLAPLFTVALGWPFLHERPGPYALLGLALTLGGVAWVIREMNFAETPHREGSALVGVISGLLGALGQGGGYVLSRAAIQTGIDPMSGNVIRITAACLAIWAWTLARGEAPRVLGSLRDREGALLTLAGTVSGPVLGVTLSLTALLFIQAGVAASIAAFHPVVAILLSARFHQEPISLRTVIAALVAATGVVILFLRG